MKEDRFFQKATRFHIWLLPCIFSLFFVLGITALNLSSLTLNAWAFLGLLIIYGLALFWYFDKVTERFRKNLVYQHDLIDALQASQSDEEAKASSVTTPLSLFKAMPNPIWIYSSEYQCLFKNHRAECWEADNDVILDNPLDFQVLQKERLSSLEDLFEQCVQRKRANNLSAEATLVRNTKKLCPIKGGCFSFELPMELGFGNGFFLSLEQIDKAPAEIEQKFFLNALPEPVFILESNHQAHSVHFANTAAIRLFQQSNQSLLGRDFLSMQMNFGSQKDISTLRKKLGHGQSHRCIIQLESEGKSNQEYEMTVAPVQSNHQLMMVRFFSRQAGTAKVVDAYGAFASADKALVDTPLQIHQALKAAKSHGSFVGFINIQIEKPIECLKTTPTQNHHSQSQVKQKLANIKRQQDHLIDLGKDRYLLVIEGKDSHSLAEATCQRVADAMINEFQRPIDIENDKWRLKCFIGSSLYKEPLSSLPVVLKETRLAASKAYKMGESHYIHFEHAQKDNNDLSLISLDGIKHAIENNELALLLQPVLNTDSLDCQHFESWLRWEHPEQGLLEPKDFLSEVADKPEMWLVDQWIIQQALTLQTNFPGTKQPISIAIKLSLQSFFQKDLAEHFTRMANQQEASLQHLILQVEEHLLVAQANLILEHLWALKALGIRVHITQAGTDILARNLLQPDAVNAIELHPALMRLSKESQPDSNSHWLMPFVQQYQALGMEVVATGVESEAALRIAKSLGCDLVRGYLFCPPVKPADTMAFLLGRESGGAYKASGKASGDSPHQTQ